MNLTCWVIPRPCFQFSEDEGSGFSELEVFWLQTVFSKCFLEPLASLARGQGGVGTYFLHTEQSVLMLGDWSVLAPEQGLPNYDTDSKRLKVWLLLAICSEPVWSYRAKIPVCPLIGI